eukprot:COSAG01_NODE_1245_length_11080_cov_39.265185_3_plen_76_part_00
MAHFRFLAYAALSISECFSARIFSTDFRLKSALQPCAFRPQSQRENPFGFILITNEPDGRARVRLNGDQNVVGIN